MERNKQQDHHPMRKKSEQIKTQKIAEIKSVEPEERAERRRQTMPRNQHKQGEKKATEKGNEKRISYHKSSPGRESNPSRNHQ